MLCLTWNGSPWNAYCQVIMAVARARFCKYKASFFAGKRALTRALSHLPNREKEILKTLTPFLLCACLHDFTLDYVT